MGYVRSNQNNKVIMEVFKPVKYYINLLIYIIENQKKNLILVRY